MNKNILVMLIVITTTGALWYIIKHEKPATNTEHWLLVGTNSDYYPYSFIKDDQIQGFDIDLINEVAHRLKKEIVLQDMPFDALIPAVQLGQIQIIAAGMTATPKRAQRVLFTNAYLQQDPLIIISHSQKPLKTVSDLAGKAVVVNEGYMADLYLSHKKDINLIRLATPIEAFLALQANRADAFVTARTSVKAFFDKHGHNEFFIAEIPGASDSYSFAVSPKYPTLLPQIQQALDEIQKDGTLTMLIKKWHLQ